MITPHGGVLIDQMLDEAGRLRALDEALALPAVPLTWEQAKTVENIATGVYSPLRGFMTAEMLRCVLASCRTPDGIAWTLPVLLPVPEETARKVRGAEKAALTLGENVLAILTVEDIFQADKAALVKSVYGTEDLRHPGVRKTLEGPDWLLGGEVWMLHSAPCAFSDYKLTPAQTRALFQQRGWHTVAAFQTRNAPHLGHEYVQKCALTVSDGLFINPVLGKKKTGDFTDEAIISSYRALIDHYYRADNTMLAVLEYEMEYAGPKEAIHHAIMRKNFGCTHMIIGRDHAGVGNFYGPYDAQTIFKNFPDLEIQPLIFNSCFYCKKCGSIVNEKICPHGQEDHTDFSGTKIRSFFASGTGDLNGLMRPEVIQAIQSIASPFIG